MSTRAASQSRQSFWRWLCGTLVVLTSLSSPILAADRAPVSLADDWMVALQAGRDARHFPRDLSSHAVATLPASTMMDLEDSLLRALDRGEHEQFVLTWRRLEAAHLLAEARLQDIGQQLQSKAVSASILQRHTEAVDSARARWDRLAVAVKPLLRRNAKQADAVDADLRRLLSERTDDARTVMGLQAMPVRYLPATAGPLRSATMFDPDYLQAADNCANFDAPLLTGAEADVSAEILAKAAELEFEYTRIYDFVRTGILTEWYPGSQRGALGTLRSGRGNDVDQASLLIALLRASGLRAAYVHGRVTAPARTLAQTMAIPAAGVDTLLHRALRPHEPIHEPGISEPVAFRFDYTWVVAQLSWDDYRGSAAQQHRGLTCVPLDTALKQHERDHYGSLFPSLGLDVDSFEASYLSSTPAQDPLAALMAMAEAWSGSQGQPLERWLNGRHISEPPQGLIPPTLPFEIEGAMAVSETLPERLGVSTQLTVSGDGIQDLVVDAPTSALTSGRLTVSFLPATWADQDLIARFGGLLDTPAYLVRFRPEVSLDGRSVAVGEPLAPGEWVSLRLRLPAGEDVVEVSQRLQVGGYAAVVLSQTGPVSSESLPPPLDGEPEAARLLANLGRRYYQQWNDDAQTLALLADETVVQPLPAAGFVLSQLEVERIEGLPLRISLDSVGLDAAMRILTPLAGVDAPADLLRLIALQGSSLEARVFDEQWSTPAVSADQVMAAAALGGVAMLDLQGPAGEAQLSATTHPAAVREKIASWLQLGFRVRLPAAPIQVGAWLGSAWLVSDAEGSSGYFLSGGLAGGITVLPPDQWYLENLAAALNDPFAKPTNPDPLAGVFVRLDASAQDQRAQHGEELDRPLGVRVEDGSGRPVQGAQVRFVLSAGEGVLIHDTSSAPEIIVATDHRGVAQARLELGNNSPLEAIVQREGETYPQRARVFKVDISVAAAVAGGNVLAGESYRAYGMPGPPAQLGLTAVPPTDPDVGLFHPPGIGYLSYRVIVVDALGHLVANVPFEIETSWSPGIEIQPPGVCATDPLTGALPAGVFLPGECPIDQLILTGHACVGTSRQLVSRAEESAFHIVPPNVVGANVRYELRSAGLPTLNLGFATTGTVVVIPESGLCRAVHGPWQSIFGHSVHEVIDGERLSDQVIFTANGSSVPGFPLAPLSSIEAARPGDLLPLPRTMHFAQRPVFADVVMQGGMVATWDMGGPSMLPPSLDDPPIAAPAADLQLSFSDGASVEDLRNIGPGVWQYQLRVPPSPARSQGELRVEFAPTPQAPQPTVLQASLPEAWAVVPSLTLEPSPIPVGVGGTLQSDLRVVLGMDPPEYRSGEVRLSLQRSGESVADLISTYGYDGFFALFGRGLRLERDQTYSAVATINAQTPFALDTDVAPLTQSSDVILGVCGNDGSAGEMSDGQMLQCVLSGRSSNLKLKRRIDIPNQRVCDMGAEIAFFLAQPATVSLRLYPIDDMDVSGAVEATLLSAEVLDEGLHRIDLTPGDVRLGTYLYEIDATGQLGNQEMVRGSLSNEPDRRDHLALGHTIVRSVDVFDGQFVLSRSDAQVAGRGPMLAFRRSYSSSLGNRIGPYGRGWSSPIEGHLSFDACGVIQAVGGEGAGGRFVYDHDDSEGNVVYRPLDGYHSSLFRRPSGDFDLYALDGTRYQYDGQEYQLRLIEDTSGNRLSYEYTPIGGRLVVTGLVQDNGRRFDLRYEVVGVDGLAMPLLQQLTGPDGIDVRYRYDEKGLLTEVRRAGLGSADPIEQFSYENFGRYPDRSNPTRSHELGWRLTTATNALSGAAIQYSYNPRWSGAEQGDGSFADVISLFVTELTETDAGTVTFSYVGERGRPGVQTTVVKNARLYDTTYTMNEFGGVERIDDPIGSQSTVWNLQHRKPHSQTDAEGVLTEFSYDAYGNTLQQRLSGRGEPVQASWTFIPPDTFDPPVIKNRAQTYTDFRGVEQTYSYDPAGRLIGHSQGGVSMSYGYDARGDQVSHTDYNGNTTETAYNNLGLPIRMTYADGAVVSMAFDARGRETLRTDELGRATITEYDGLDRPLRVDPPGPGDRRTVYDDSTPSITSFDELERSTITVMDKQGRAVSITNALNDSRTMSYDDHGNLEEETDFRGNPRTAIFDALDRRISLSEPESRNTTYTYLKTGQMTEMTVSGAGGERTTRYRYEHPRYFRTGEFGVLDGEEIGTTLVLDGEGNPLTRTDALDRETTSSFDAFGRPLLVSEPEGRTTTHVYDPQGNLLSRTVAGGGGSRTESFEYDLRHRQIVRVDGVDERWLTGYDAKGNRISETDPLGRVSHYAYDLRDRLITQQLPGEGRVSSYGYDAVDNRISESLPSGQEIIHSYDDLNRLVSSTDQLGPIATFDYDPDGHVITSTDGRALPTTTVWDSLGRKESELQPEGRNWSWTWNAWDQPLTETNPRTITVIHQYDTLGRRLNSTDPLGTQTWDYDAIGNVLSQSNRRNHATTFDYDDLNRRVAQTDPTTETQQFGYNAFNELIRQVDRRGIETTTAYDDAGRVLAINRAGLTRQRFLYDAAGQQTSRFDPLGRETRSQYDLAGRVEVETLPEGARIERSWTAADDLASQTDPDGLAVAYQYDERRRLVSETNDLDETTVYDYDGNGNRTAMTRPLATEWIFEFDDANRLVAVVNPLTQRTEYGYDENGNRTSILDANNHTRTFEFDELDRMTAMHYPGGATEITERDPEGNPETTIRANGQQIMRVFDERHRLVSETFAPVTEDGIESIDYEYNGNDAIIQVTETLSSGSCPGGGTVCTSSYAFDDLDRLIQATDRNGLSFSQRYDAADNRLARTGPEGETVYVYNGLDQITVVTPPDAAAIGLDPTAAGRWGEISHGNGVRTQVQYDGAGRMNAVRHWLGAAAVLLSTYSFDANGNRRTETIEAQSQSWLTTYDYDDADRLSGYTAPEGQTSYLLDAVGNRTQTTTGGQLSTADFDPRDRLTDIRDSGGQVVTHYDYDEAGRQTAQTSGGQTTHYSYSATDRLLAIRQGSPSAEPLVRYEYHRLSRGSANGGQRSARTDAGSREHYQWDGLKLTTRTNALGNPLARYSHANGWTLASSEQGAEYSYQLDALGTPLILTDEAAAIAVRYRLDPWGVVLEQTQAHVNPIGFTGYLRDTATDQLYAQARQYLPGVGRFGSVDPWEGDGLRPITLNSYLYGNGNPGVWVDPDGRITLLNEDAQGVTSRLSEASLAVADNAKGAWRDSPWYAKPGLAVAWGGAGASYLTAEAGSFLVVGANLFANAMVAGTDMLGDAVGVPETAFSGLAREAYHETSSFVGAAAPAAEAFADRPGESTIAAGSAVGASVLATYESVLNGESKAIYDVLSNFNPAKAGKNIGSTVFGVGDKRIAAVSKHGTTIEDPSGILGVSADQAHVLGNAGANSNRGALAQTNVSALADGKIHFRRWQRGDAIDKPLPDGSAPSWGTIQSRYWKNRALAAAKTREFSVENLRRMQRGSAPQDYNPRTGNFESRELHHVIPQRAGGASDPLNLRELTPDQHGAVDPYRHTVPTTTGIL